jgi:hypothetical protein
MDAQTVPVLEVLDLVKSGGTVIMALWIVCRWVVHPLVVGLVEQNKESQAVFFAQVVERYRHVEERLAALLEEVRKGGRP